MALTPEERAAVRKVKQRGYVREYARRRRQTNRAQYNSQQRAYRAANREQINVQQRAWRDANRERINTQNRDKGRVKPGARREYHRAYGQRRRQIHGEQINAQRRAKRAANPDKGRAKPGARRVINRAQSNARQRAWLRAHPEYRQVQNQRRRARKRALAHDLTLAQWRTIKGHYGHRCVYCGKKQTRLTQDHLTPMIKGGGTTMHNIVPACKSCNSKKGTGAVLKPVQPLLL